MSDLPWNTLLFTLPLSFLLVHTQRHHWVHWTTRAAAALKHGSSKGHAERDSLKQLKSILLDLVSRFEAGWLPPEATLQHLLDPSLKPLGRLVRETLDHLRQQGAAVLPTLRRFLALTETQHEALLSAFVRSSQSLWQARIGAAALALQSVCLFAWMPGVQRAPWIWGAVCATSLTLALWGCRWVAKMAYHAQWGGLTPSMRDQWIWFLSAFERWSSLVQGGWAADRAWTDTHGWLVESNEGHAPRALAESWKPLLWDLQDAPHHTPPSIYEEGCFKLRQAIVLCYQDGRPCLELAQSTFQGLLQAQRARVDTLLQQLPTRSLLPLGLCVAPGCFVQLGVALVLSFIHQDGNSIF